jgi:hypothetical protein
VFRTIHRSDVVAAVITGAAVVAAVEAGKLANLLIGAAMVSCVLVGLRITLERMLERIASDSYDSGKMAERRAIVRDLAEYVAKRNAG